MSLEPGTLTLKFDSDLLRLRRRSFTDVRFNVTSSILLTSTKEIKQKKPKRLLIIQYRRILKIVG